MDLNELIQHLHVLDAEALLSPQVLTNIREMRNRLAHTNDCGAAPAAAGAPVPVRGSGD
jgi:hypothetical protein